MSGPDQPRIILDSDWRKPGQGTGAGPGAGGSAPAAGAAKAEGAPKLVVDSDWKSQAQAERERLAEAEKKAAANKPAGGVGGGRGSRELPPADFDTLVGTMLTQALMYLGGFPDPQTGRAIVSLEHAKFHIDLLDVLAQKVKGNLTKEEEENLTGALHELRARFVEIAQAVAQMARERAAGGGAGQPGGVPKGPPLGGPAGTILGP
jgi:hypothetical protein